MDKDNTANNEWLTLSEAAKIVGVDARTLERLILQHSVPVINLDRGFRVTLKDLELIKKPLPTSASEPLGMNVSDLPLAEELDEARSKGKIVAVASASDLSNKASVALLLGKTLRTLKDATVCVVDLNQGNLLGEVGFLTGNSKPTMLNLRLNGLSEKVLDETIITSSRLDLDLLLAPVRPQGVESMPGDFVEELLEDLADRYDYVIVNTTSGTNLDPARSAALKKAFWVVYVTDVSVLSVFAMTRWIQFMSKPESSGGEGINPNKMGVVVNEALADVNMSSEKIERSSLGLPIVSVIPSVGQRFVRAVNLQSLETLLDIDTVQAAYQRLAKSLG